MRRLAVLAALVAAFTTLAAPSRAAETRIAPPRASVELVSFDPLRVRGERFRARERVRVTVRVDGRIAIARTRAGRRGGFVVALAASATAGRCIGAVRVAAVGDRGSRGTLAVDHVACVPTS